ncbi:MAG: YqfQ family protein [Sporolactobacillus sp.]|uniref:YqfQ family protein n=1 Tax=Sporolactobacillus sp. STSJ-5 TaxID=2965076 RepID=UPI0021049CA7|nr:YqfQ family protein [Sporolactobacillus sp. STSJ-5]MCQ2008427.1 YqfQ family protein [Sporolactobacillus sp. STSJ-5]
MPPFEHGHEQPFYWNSPTTSTPPMTPTRGFPPIFPRMPAQAPPVPVPAPQGTGGLSGLIASFLSPSAAGTTGSLNLLGMITNAQKAIQTAQTVLPMIQQFGPLVKNAPAILSALKGMQGDTASTETDKSDTTEQLDTPTAASDTKLDNHSNSTIHKTEQLNHENTTNEQTAAGSVKTNAPDSLLNSESLPTKPSVPRMYI